MKIIITNFNDETGDFRVVTPVPFKLKDGIEYVGMIVADIPKYEDIKDYNVFDLIRENQELKKQLEKKYEEVGTLTGELLYEENTKLINQQKEFIEWLEQNIENEEYCYLAQNPSEHCRKDVFEEVLSKYKEIIGVKDE